MKKKHVHSKEICKEGRNSIFTGSKVWSQTCRFLAPSHSSCPEDWRQTNKHLTSKWYSATSKVPGHYLVLAWSHHYLVLVTQWFDEKEAKSQKGQVAFPGSWNKLLLQSRWKPGTHPGHCSQKSNVRTSSVGRALGQRNRDRYSSH